MRAFNCAPSACNKWLPSPVVSIIAFGCDEGDGCVCCLLNRRRMAVLAQSIERMGRKSDQQQNNKRKTRCNAIRHVFAFAGVSSRHHPPSSRLPFISARPSRDALPRESEPLPWLCHGPRPRIRATSWADPSNSAQPSAARRGAWGETGVALGVNRDRIIHNSHRR